MTEPENVLPFLNGGGEMGARIRAIDWSATPFGPPQHWPQPLRSALSICLTSSFPTAIYWGTELRLLYNDAWAPIPAEKHPWALGRPAREVWADIWPVVGPQLAQVIERREGFSTFDQMLPMQRGGKVQETYWNYSFTPILDDAGRVVGVFNQGHETTAQILARREREAQIEWLREMFEQAPGAVALLRGPDHVFDIANAAYLRLAGRNDICGKSVADALPEVVGQGFVDLLDRVYRTGEPYIGHNVPVKLARPGTGYEERILDFIYQPVRTGGEVSGIFVQSTDVTERARAEDALHALNATLEQRISEEVARRSEAEQALRQAQKMEAIGQLTGGIAHDFNNMLAVVIGGLNLLRRRLRQGQVDVDSYIEGALEGAQRASALTQRLLAFARQQPLEPVAIDPNRMVTEMSELLTRTLGETIEVHTVLGTDLWRVRADRNQLENAVLNLAVNARDSMPDGGRLTIRTSNVPVHDPEMVCEPGEYVLLEVGDTGSGMTPEVMARAFDPFYTTKPVGRGTGLGLSQVFGFVTQSGGCVTLSSEPGHGTCVRIYLPRFIGHSDDQQLEATHQASHRGHAEEIVMVVEDEPRVRAFSAEALRDLGYSVLTPETAREALMLIENGQPVTVLFTDMVMPDMTGRQLAALAQRKLPNLRAVYTSGYSRDTSGADAAFLPKPFSIEQLAARIRSAIDG